MASIKRFVEIIDAFIIDNSHFGKKFEARFGRKLSQTHGIW